MNNTQREVLPSRNVNKQLVDFPRAAPQKWSDPGKLNKGWLFSTFPLRDNGKGRQMCRSRPWHLPLVGMPIKSLLLSGLLTLPQMHLAETPGKRSEIAGF